MTMKYFRLLFLAAALAASVTPLLSATYTITVAAEPGQPVNRRVFGGTYADLRGNPDAYAQLGMTTCRGFGFGIDSVGSVNPEPGKFTWDHIDPWLVWLKKENVKPIVLLHGWADWMMQGGSPAPADWDFFIKSWSDYAAEAVRHFNVERKEGCRDWEIWNEPDGGYWVGEAWNKDYANYGRLFRATAEKMKAVDPTIRIATAGLADPFGDARTLENWWVPLVSDPEVAKHVDAVALHGYYGDPANGIFANGIDHAREVIQKSLGRDVPIWITEFNIVSNESFTKSGLPLSTQALYIAEYLAIFVDKGIDVANYFCVGWPGSDYALWEQDSGAKRPAFHAFEFWKDYVGRTLPVTAGATISSAVACANYPKRTLYVPVRKGGEYVVEFDGITKIDEVTVDAFYGAETYPLKHSVMQEAGKVKVSFGFPSGSRALVKVTVREVQNARSR